MEKNEFLPAEERIQGTGGKNPSLEEKAGDLSLCVGGDQNNGFRRKSP